MTLSTVLSSWRVLGLLIIVAIGLATPAAAQQTAKPPVSAPSATTPDAAGAAAPPPATAQPAPPAAPGTPPPTSVSTDDLQKLVATLKSDTDRAKLIAQLQAMIDAQHKVEERPGLASVVIQSLSTGLSQIADMLSQAGTQLTDLSGLWHWASHAAADQELRARLLEAALRIAGILGCGLIAFVAVYFLLGRLASRILARLPSSWMGKLAGAVLTFFIHAAPLAAFAAAAFLAMPFLLARLHVHMSEIIVAAINAVLVSGLLVALGRAVLQPAASHVRVLNWSDETAAYADVWLRRFVLIAVFGYVGLETASLFGLPFTAHAALQRLLGLLMCVLMVVVILQNRHGIAQWLKTSRRGAAAIGSLRARLSDNWHLFAIVYVLFVFVIWLLHPSAGLEFLLRDTFLTALVLVLVVAAERGVERVLRRVLAIGRELKQRFPAMEERANRYLSLVFVLLRVAAGLVALLIVLRIWGFDSFSLLADQPGRQIVGGVLRIIGIVVGAMALWELGALALQRYLERNGRTGRLGQARVNTLLPVARNLFGITVLVLAVLMLLSEVGIAIGPLLAGAGIVGIALGLGAQNLVKDMIGGFSLIMEDAIAVGDVVKIGGNSGVVEAMSIRWLRLRGLDGTVQYIPLGSVSVVENMTKEFSYAVIDANVAYGTKVDDVVQALNDIGEDLMHDPVFGPQILAPLEMLGLDRFADSAIVVRCRFKTKAASQWNIMREFNKRMKAVFDARGIEIPFPHLTLTVNSAMQQLLSAQPAAAAAAAAEAVTAAVAGKAPTEG